MGEAYIYIKLACLNILIPFNFDLQFKSQNA